MLPLAPNRLIIQIDAQNRVRAHVRRIFLHFAQGDVFGSAQFFFVSARAAADDITDAGENILEHVGAHDRFAADDAQVFRDRLIFDAGCCGDDHSLPLVFHWLPLNRDTRRIVQADLRFG